MLSCRAQRGLCMYLYKLSQRIARLLLIMYTTAA
jgi:hypothetical protein